MLSTVYHQEPCYGPLEKSISKPLIYSAFSSMWPVACSYNSAILAIHLSVALLSFTVITHSRKCTLASGHLRHSQITFWAGAALCLRSGTAGCWWHLNNLFMSPEPNKPKVCRHAWTHSLKKLSQLFPVLPSQKQTPDSRLSFESCNGSMEGNCTAGRTSAWPAQDISKLLNTDLWIIHS